MKNADIHKAFGKVDIRDFLAQRYEEAQDETLGRSSQSIEEEISVLQEKLRFAKQYEAVLELAQSQDWTFWDVSDEIEGWNRETYMPFLGTEEEYITLVETLRSG